MSVERIAPLGPATTDAPASRGVGGAAAGHARAPSLFPPSAPAESSRLRRYDSLVLPLPDAATPDDRQFPGSLISAAYTKEATRTLTASLIDGRLPEAVIRHEVEALLHDMAEARGVPIGRLIEDTETTPSDLLPSRNAKAAHFAFKGRIRAYDAEGKLKLFALYLTRLGPRQWEAATFERNPAIANPTFPRATPPIDLSRLVIDPGSGFILACVAQQVASGGFSRPATTRLFVRDALRAIGYVILGVAITLILARLLPWPAAAILVALLALVVRPAD